MKKQVHTGETRELGSVPAGSTVLFPHRRKKFLVRSHLASYIKVRPGFDYPDGRNYDTYPGTWLRDSSGRTYLVRSDKAVHVQ